MSILGLNVHGTSYQHATKRIMEWANHGQPKYVCVANVHMVIEGWDERDFREIVNRADLVTPDGMPLVWLLKKRGVIEATRVYGPTLTLRLCEAAAKMKLPVGFYGGTVSECCGIAQRMWLRFPGLTVAYAYSPPYRQMSAWEDEEIIRNIVDSGTRILFVGLGCPKQERWMAAHRDRLPVVQIGVGAAFAIHSGALPQAPEWMQKIGMEWAFRLLMEPRRLFRRYIVGNSRFILLLARERFGRLDIE